MGSLFWEKKIIVLSLLLCLFHSYHLSFTIALLSLLKTFAEFYFNYLLYGIAGKKRTSSSSCLFFFFFKLLHYHIVHVLINALGSWTKMLAIPLPHGSIKHRRVYLNISKSRPEVYKLKTMHTGGWADYFSSSCFMPYLLYLSLSE